MKDFRSNPLIRKDFQQKAVRKTSIDKVNPVYARIQRLYRTIDLRLHSLADRAISFQFVNLIYPQCWDKRIEIAWIAQQTWYIAQIN